MIPQNRADSRFVPSQWETPLQSNAVSHWLGANLESALTVCCNLLDRDITKPDTPIKIKILSIPANTYFYFYIAEFPMDQIEEILLQTSSFIYFSSWDS